MAGGIFSPWGARQNVVLSADGIKANQVVGSVARHARVYRQNPPSLLLCIGKPSHAPRSPRQCVAEMMVADAHVQTQTQRIRNRHTHAPHALRPHGRRPTLAAQRVGGAAQA